MEKHENAFEILIISKLVNLEHSNYLLVLTN